MLRQSLELRDIHYHYVRDLVKNNQVAFEFIPTKQQVADFLTKPLPKVGHWYCSNMVGLL